MMHMILLSVNQTDLMNAFKLMGLGMASIFVVMIVLFGSIKLLGRLFKEGKD